MRRWHGAVVGMRVGGMVRVCVCGTADEGKEGLVVRKEVGLGDVELEVTDVEKLTLDAADVALAKSSHAERPVDVLEGGVIQALREDGETR